MGRSKPKLLVILTVNWLASSSLALSAKSGALVGSGMSKAPPIAVPYVYDAAGIGEPRRTTGRIAKAGTRVRAIAAKRAIRTILLAVVSRRFDKFDFSRGKAILQELCKDKRRMGKSEKDGVESSDVK